MLIRLLTVAALLSTSLALENPCKDKQTTGCADQVTSCDKVFPVTAGVPSDKCFNKADGDYAMTPLCRATCQTCCLDDEFNCDDDPIPGLICPKTEEECNQFGDINWEHCRSSCGWCALQAKPCHDMVTNCVDFKKADVDLCSNPEVSVQCELTCGVCTSPECNDNSARCPIWFANGFCEDAFYTDVKANYCKKTCDMCGN